ncbi:glutathione S-transferase family protein [Rhizobium sp. CC-YZS058]|uniref:glutathione S-transferase family protein n=1 Tax=Rhizobium sp. CC-YZS058 TaxID=3042153 RepID=UPI002B054B14|nr:glutathione S-transferase family protein [Rhizobium sp. CC-YZS058]MEA3534975.1 glutathione S-transferase family protein [Rhizobium sp. CC-YZS058]
MTETLTLYTNPMSRGRIARWMLEETGIPYRRELLTYGGSMKSPAYLAINPMGKVPAIVHEGRVVTECAAICAYLADAFPETGLAPTPSERAAYYRWMFFAAGPLESAVVNRTLKVEIAPEQQRMVGYGSYGHALDALETALSASAYIAGDRFTAADVYVGSAVSWGLAFKTIEDRPAFAAYAARLATRPAALRAKDLDDADAATLHSTP